MPVWKDTDTGFKADMQIYADAWNEMQHSLPERKQDLNAINLFVKSCFAVAKAASFDLSTLTVNNFGGKTADLLGTAAPTAGSLIAAAVLPSCNLELGKLNKMIASLRSE